MEEGGNPKSFEDGWPVWFRATFGAKLREFSFVPAEDMPARQDNRLSLLDGQIIYRFERGRWVPLEDVHTVINIQSKTIVAGRRVFVSQMTDGPFVAISQEDRESG
jgi:hypothetical protein